MLTAKKFFALLARATGTEYEPFLRSICWFVANVERKFWTESPEKYSDIWNILYLAKLTMPYSEKLRLPRYFIYYIEAI
jgi:hypothetical protein